VLVEDTTGSGARAVPTINAAGNITGFTITNPGNNYSATPTIGLIRGDIGGSAGTTVPAANVTLAANSTFTGGLTKKGSGNLILSGTNTYRGDTLVQNGTLSLSPTVPGGYLADGADVMLSTGTTLALHTSATTDTIRSLYIHGVLQAAGVWGAIGSGAVHVSALITGTGFLNVTVGTGGGYAAWAAINAGGQAANLDFNNDGIGNGVAYFMNRAGFITIPGFNGANQVTWPNGGNIPSSAYGTQFVVQASSDLQTWTDVPVDQLDANANFSAGPPPVDGSLSYTLTGSGRRFVRVDVTPN